MSESDRSRRPPVLHPFLCGFTITTNPLNPNEMLVSSDTIEPMTLREMSFEQRKTWNLKRGAPIYNPYQFEPDTDEDEPLPLFATKRQIRKRNIKEVMKVAWDHRRNVKAELREQCREYIEEIRQHEEEMKPCGGDMERHATMMSKYEGEIMELEETKQRHLKKIKDHEEEIQKLKEAKARSQKQMAEVDQELRSVLGRTNQEWEKYFRGLREQDQGYGERQ